MSQVVLDMRGSTTRRRWSGLLLAAGLALTACSGSAGAITGPTPSPSSASIPSSPSLAIVPAATPTATPTQAPTPTPALKSINDLINATHPKTTASTALAAVKAAVSAHPGGFYGGWTISDWTRAFSQCQKGDLSLGGDPYEIRTLGCRNVLYALLYSYKESGDAAKYQAAVAVYDYGFNALSDVNGRDYWTDWVPGYLRLLDQSLHRPPAADETELHS